MEVRPTRKGYAVLVKKKNTGGEKEIETEKVMVAVGRVSNADLLKVQNAGLETTEAHYIEVNDYLQTAKKDIWALGDAIKSQMFTHAASKEVEVAWHNATQRRKMNSRIVPHAVFTQPQIASVGFTEEQARRDQVAPLFQQQPCLPYEPFKGSILHSSKQIKIVTSTN